MKIIDIVHQCCENYFNLYSPEVKNPISKVVLSFLKALSMATLVIPLAVYLADRITRTEKPIGTTPQKMNAVTTSLVPAQSAPIENPALANRAETVIDYSTKRWKPEYALAYAWDKNSDAYKQAIATYEARAVSANEWVWNPFKDFIEHPGLAYLLPERENSHLLMYLQKAFEENPEMLLGWMNINPNFFKDRFQNEEIPFKMDFNRGISLDETSKKIVLAIPITELKIYGEFHSLETLEILHSTLRGMEHLKKLDAQFARHLPSYTPQFSHPPSSAGFFTGLNVHELSLFVSALDLETLDLPHSITKLTIRAEKDKTGFNERNEKIRQNLQKLPHLEEITLADLPNSCSEFLGNIPDQCKVVKIETCGYHISVDALIKRFQATPLETLYLKNYEGFKNSQYTADEIEKLKQAKIAKKIVVETYS